MCSELWTKAISISSVIGLVLSTLLNLILLWFLSRTQRKKFGYYKYFMMWFSATGIFYSLTNFISRPNVHITNSSFYVFTALVFGTSKSMGTIAVTIYCSCYATMLSLLAIQFYYRYTSVTSPRRLTMFSWGCNTLRWAMVVLVYTGIWAIVCLVLCGPTPLKDKEIDEEILKVYCMTNDEYAYVGAQYFYTDPVTLEEHWHLPSLIGMGTFFFIMLATLVLIVFFAIRIYQTLTEEGLPGFCSKELQKQFFQTLVIQTAIPFFFMYVPVTCLFLFPITGWVMHGMQNWIPVLVAIYPGLQPLVALICLREFRTSIYNTLTCRRRRRKVAGMALTDVSTESRN